MKRSKHNMMTLSIIVCYAELHYLMNYVGQK